MLVREVVYEALFAQTAGLAIGAGGPFQTLSRKFVQYQSVPAPEQPALYQRTANTNVSQSDDFGIPTYRMKAWWFIYCQVSPDSGTLPATTLNVLIDAAVNAMQPGVNSVNNLNNCPNVVHAWVDGEILTYEGLLPSDTNAWAVIPITILAGV